MLNALAATLSQHVIFPQSDLDASAASPPLPGDGRAQT